MREELGRRGSRQRSSAGKRVGRRGIAPGKATRTSKLPPGIVQRKPSSSSSREQPVNPLHEWMHDPDLLAAHGFWNEENSGANGHGAKPKSPAGPVQAKPDSASASADVVSVEDGPPPDAVIIVVAKRRGAEVARWSGPMDWYWELPMRFTGKRTRAGWQWSDEQAASLGLRSAHREQGGIPVTRWAREHGATEIEIVLVPHPGQAHADAGADGYGTRGQGMGGDAGGEASAGRLEAGEERSAASDDTGDLTTMFAGGAGLGAHGSGSGAGRDGDLARPGAGRASGSEGGDPRGSEEPSWVHPAGAEIAKEGGRTPTEHGRRGGSAGGRVGGTGHVDGAGWLNVLDVPEAVAPAINVAVIITDANITGAGERLFRQAIKKISREALDSAIEREARRVIRRALKREERRLREVRGLSRSERARILGDAHQALEREFRVRLGAHVRERAADSEALIAELADKTDEVSLHARELARENAAAYRRIEASASRSAAGREAEAAARPGHGQRAGEAASSARVAGLLGESVAVQRVHLANSTHAVRAQRIGDEVQIWLCSDCGRMRDKIEAVLARVADSGATKSLHRRLVKLRDKLRDAETRLAAGALSREHLHRELNQIGAHLRDLSRKHPRFDELCFFESFRATKLAPEEVFDAAAFEKSLVGLSPGERVAAVRQMGETMARKYGWKLDDQISKLNKRDVYRDPESMKLFGLDTQHGRFEINHPRSGKHQGEENFDLKPTKPAVKSGRHDLRVK